MLDYLLVCTGNLRQNSKNMAGIIPVITPPQNGVMIEPLMIEPLVRMVLGSRWRLDLVVGDSNLDHMLL